MSVLRFSRLNNQIKPIGSCSLLTVIPLVSQNLLKASFSNDSKFNKGLNFIPHATLETLATTSTKPPLPGSSKASPQIQHPTSVSESRTRSGSPPPKRNYEELTDMEIIQAVEEGKIKLPNLEKILENQARAVRIRREILGKGRDGLQFLPYEGMSYEKVSGQCCENVVGYTQIPVGLAGPLVVDGAEYYVPMATTEGALVASTSRGCKAISVSGGSRTEILSDAMSRAPVLQVESVRTAMKIKRYVEKNFSSIAEQFNSTSRFARLASISTHIAGRKIFLRFRSSSGDAMGMNMVGKGVEHALKLIIQEFPEARVLALSGNMCTDKKPSAINWIEGRGKSVIAEATIPGEVVTSVLKTTIPSLLEVNMAKNLVGSVMAGSIGGNNAHAANVVTAIFLATGQDPAQNVESSNCITLFEPINDGKDLYVSVTLPTMEVGTVGGGTALPAQQAMLKLLGVDGAHPEVPGQNAATLARIIASTVLAGELSLMSALASGDLIKSHMLLNRRKH